MATRTTAAASPSISILVRRMHIRTTKSEGQRQRIFIRELWSSPMVFARGQVEQTCDDALAFTAGGQTAVEVNRTRSLLVWPREIGFWYSAKMRMARPTDLGPILVKIDDVFSKINGSHNLLFRPQLSRALPKVDRR